MLSADYLLSLILRWMHIFATVTAVGGMIYLKFMLLPALDKLPEKERKELMVDVQSRWRKFVLGAITLLLLSGLINTLRIARGYEFPGGYYHALLGVKILLAIVVFGISSLLIGRSGLANRVKENAPFWLKVNLTLASVIICLAGVLRFAVREEKTGQETGGAPPATLTATLDSGAQKP